MGNQQETEGERKRRRERERKRKREINYSSNRWHTTHPMLGYKPTYTGNSYQRGNESKRRKYLYQKE